MVTKLVLLPLIALRRSIGDSNASSNANRYPNVGISVRQGASQTKTLLAVTFYGLSPRTANIATLQSS